MERLESLRDKAKNTWNIALKKDYDHHVNPEAYQEQVVRDGRKSIADYVAERFTELIPPSDGEPSPQILDLATGTGLIAQALEEAGFKVVGMDLSEQLLLHAKEQQPRTLFVRGDMNDDLPFRTDSFAGVTSVWANRYMSRSKYFLREAHRVLKEDGALVWPIFPYEGPLWKLNSGRFQPTSIEALAEQAERAGFHNVEIHRPSHREQREHGIHRISVYNTLTARK